MRSEFLASSWKYFRGCNHTLVHCGTVSWVKKFSGSPLNHENHENFIPPKNTGYMVFAFEALFGKVESEDNRSCQGEWIG